MTWGRKTFVRALAAASASAAYIISMLYCDNVFV